MQNENTLSKQQLLEMVQRQGVQLADKDTQLTERDADLAAERKEILIKLDTIRQLESKLAQSQKDYLQLWRDRFGRKSERYIADSDQLRIDFGDTDESADAAEGLADAVEEADLIPAHRRRKPKKKTPAFPAHFPRKEEIIDAAESQKTCSEHGPKQLLPESMWDQREQLIHIPARFEVLVRKYKKYACQGHKDCGIASAERPTGIVEGDKYDASVAATIITQKYGYHLPLYRQQNMFASSGWTPSRSLMLNILQQCYFIITPLLAYFRQTLQTDSIVACDDTGVKLLYPKVPPDFDLTDAKQKRAAEVFEKALAGNKSSINAKMWAYRGVNVALNVFDFTVSRHRDGPDLFYDNFEGTILGDCWHGFGAIALESDGKIVRAACNSHARRKFESVTDYPADRDKWMSWFFALYDVEHQADEQAAEEQANAPLKDEALRTRELSIRKRLRQSQGQPIWGQMKAELAAIDDRTEQVVLPKSDLRKALNYLRNHWAELTRYLDDPELSMDNNECEQLMRAHRSDLDVWAYVDDVLRRLLAGETDYEPLLPWNWAAEHPESIRIYCQEERRETKARKRLKRERRRRDRNKKKN